MACGIQKLLHKEEKGWNRNCTKRCHPWCLQGKQRLVSVWDQALIPPKVVSGGPDFTLPCSPWLWRHSEGFPCGEISSRVTGSISSCKDQVSFVLAWAACTCWSVARQAASPQSRASLMDAEVGSLGKWWVLLLVRQALVLLV